MSTLINLEELLDTIIEEEFETYLDQCNLDEDRSIDENDFAKVAKEMIEYNHGKEKFDDFNIEAFARIYAESNSDAVFERAVDAADDLYECQRESEWT